MERDEKAELSSGPAAAERQVTRHESWRLQYGKDRYIAHLDHAQLVERLYDILDNSAEITPRGLISPVGLDPQDTYWMEKFTHVLEEFALRSLHLPERDPSRIGILRHPGYDFVSVASAIANISPKVPFLVKYGSRAFLELARERGVIRVLPASSYADPSLGPARFDNELRKELTPRSDGAVLQVKDEATGEYHRVGTIQNLVWRTTSRSDYHVYCMAAALKPRLFADFSADACLVVHEPKEFIRRLMDSSPPPAEGTQAEFGPVRYFDPLLANPDDIGIGLSKNFRFQYQAEWRFMWFPPEPSDRLQPIELELGSLCDIAELVCL